MPRSLTFCSVFFLSMLAFAILGGLTVFLRPDMIRTRENVADSQATILVYCAASLQPAIQRSIDQRSEESSGPEFRIVRSGGSGQLAGQIGTEASLKIENGADVCILSDHHKMAMLVDKGVVGSPVLIAVQRPVIVVPVSFKRTDPKTVAAMCDGKLRFGIASSEAAIGVIVRKIAEDQRVLENLEKGRSLETENVMTLANAVASGSLDAAVVWESVVHQINRQAGQLRLRIVADADPDGRRVGRVEIAEILGQVGKRRLAIRMWIADLQDSEKGGRFLAEAGFGRPE